VIQLVYFAMDIQSHRTYTKWKRGSDRGCQQTS